MHILHFSTQTIPGLHLKSSYSLEDRFQQLFYLGALFVTVLNSRKYQHLFFLLPSHFLLAPMAPI